MNDRHGHAEGDRALQEVAGVLRGIVRARDLIARIGGDEFVLLLPDTGVEAARTMLERIREHLADAMRAQNWPITVSIGAVVFPRAPASIDAALRRADELMYRAKAGGKNRVNLVIDETASGAAESA